MVKFRVGGHDDQAQRQLLDDLEQQAAGGELVEPLSHRLSPTPDTMDILRSPSPPPSPPSPPPADAESGPRKVSWSTSSRDLAGSGSEHGASTPRPMLRRGSDGSRIVRTRTGSIRNLEVHKLTEATSKEISNRYRSKVKEDLDRGWVWECKTFCLFPLLTRLTHVDHIFRVCFPLAYAIFTLAALAEVDFGRTQYEKLLTARCYVGEA